MVTEILMRDVAFVNDLATRGFVYIDIKPANLNRPVPA